MSFDTCRETDLHLSYRRFKGRSARLLPPSRYGGLVRRLFLSGLSLVLGLAFAPVSALAALHPGACPALHRQNPAVTGTVVGRVTNKTGGAGIPGVTVTIVGSRL